MQLLLPPKPLSTHYCMAQLYYSLGAKGSILALACAQMRRNRHSQGFASPESRDSAVVRPRSNCMCCDLEFCLVLLHSFEREYA